jgi:hypothetical protein
LWHPDDGLNKPKHVAATVIILNVLIIHILIQFLCISWTITNVLLLLIHGTTMRILD